MIAVVYGPCGIVAATLSEDVFYEVRGEEGHQQQVPIRIKGLTHTIALWNRYVLMYNNLNTFHYENMLSQIVEQLVARWNKPLPLAEFMPYLKQMLIDNNIQVVGVVAGYDDQPTADASAGSPQPFVYQVLGFDVQRINTDPKGHVTYNYVCLEKESYVGKLMGRCKLSNGDDWEEYDHIHVRCDLFSIEKSIDFCQFMLHTNHFVANIHSVCYADPLAYEIAVLTPGQLECRRITE